MEATRDFTSVHHQHLSHNREQRKVCLKGLNVDLMAPLHKEVLSEDGSLTDAVFCVFVWRPPGYTLSDIRVVTPPTKSFQSADKDTIRELQP